MTIQLVGQAGPYTGSYFVLEPGEHIIGRRARCTISLPQDKKVSREHAVLDVGRESARLTDAGSRNGSFVNNERIIERNLQAGDILRFGDTVFRVEIIPDKEGMETTTSGLESVLSSPEELFPTTPTAEEPQPEGREAEALPSSAEPSRLSLVGGEIAVPRLCPNCGEEIPPKQTYGVCAFCACNLMPIFKGLVHVQRDISGTQRLTCSHCSNLIGDYSQMVCSVCHLNFVTGRFPDGVSPGQVSPLAATPPPPLPTPPPEPEVASSEPSSLSWLRRLYRRG